MIQDIGPHVFHNEYCPKPPEKESCLLVYRQKEVLLKRNAKGEIRFPTFEEMEPYNGGLYEEYTYLFTIDSRRFYLGTNISAEPLSGYAMENLEVFRTAVPKELAFAGITGAQLYRWYESRRYCGKCGCKMRPHEKERMMYCPECGSQEYPRIMPAVIIGITDGNRILMSKYADRDFKKYALIAGFAEIGESIEDTVRREVMEEVGLKVKNIRYYKSQPWSFSDTLLLGFYAELDGDGKVTLDREELALAEWFERDEIPVKESDLSLTNEMIIQFRDGKI